MNFEKFDICDLDIFKLQGLGDIRKRPDILGHIKFNVTPQIVMEPRFQADPGDREKVKGISGYMFYIEAECTPPVLMLMKIGKTDIASTIGRIDEIPADLIRRAIDKPVHPAVHGMYAISDEIRDWLKEALGL